MKEYLLIRNYGIDTFKDIITTNILTFIDTYRKFIKELFPDYASIIDLETGEVLYIFDRTGEHLYLSFSDS